MLDKLSVILSQSCRLKLDQPLLVGVSGGPDSLCLMDVVHKAGYPLVAACLDHGIRPEAVKETELVQQMASSLGIMCVTSAVDTNLFARQQGLSVEAAARQLRYDFLFAEARKIHAQAVVVGHTADDQAETIVLHLLRGAGLTGLKGMEFRSFLPTWSNEIPVVRPLLATWRKEVLEYCEHNGLNPVQDATNLSLDYFRNRIRHEVIPYLEQVQPHLRQHLVRMAGTLAGDYELIQTLVETAWENCLVRQGPGFVAFSREPFLAQPVGIQRYLLRKAMLSHRQGFQDIELAMVERARHAIAGASGHKTFHLGAGLRLHVEGDLAWVATWEAGWPEGDYPAISPDQVSVLPVPGQLHILNGWVLTAEIFEAQAVQEYLTKDAQDPSQSWFDLDEIELPLRVRTRLPGDRMRPLGMAGKTVKLSDLMINLKLPYQSRSRWPLVCAGSEIIWLAGCRAGIRGSLNQATQRAVRLTLAQASASLDPS